MAAEPKRGCGYRKIGGLYLCADGPGDPCHRLPIPLEVCPTCHAGIKQTRGWTWVKPELLGGPCNSILDHVTLWNAETRELTNQNGADFVGVPPHCVRCPACNPKLLGEKAGLIWIGTQFYKTPADFTREAEQMGVSRRITAIPKGFRVGEHWILVAHPKAISRKEVNQDALADLGADVATGDCTEEVAVRLATVKVDVPGIFHVFKPSRIEKILADDASPEVIKEWEDKGCKVVLLPANDKDHQGTVYEEAAAQGL